jgi:secondary thiamine-phosphate synthase enzyme
MQSITVQTDRRCDMIDVTDRVQQIVSDAGIKTGYVICYVPHTTAGVTIQENADPDVVHDFLWKLERLIPKDDSGFLHGDAHIKASLTGLSQTILIEEGRLVLGTWQGIYFCEYDGPRTRKLLIKCVTT